MATGGMPSSNAEQTLTDARTCVSDLLTAIAWEMSDRMDLLRRAERQLAALRGIVADPPDEETGARAEQLIAELDLARADLGATTERD
jgi:hypothetical protein